MPPHHAAALHVTGPGEALCLWSAMSSVGCLHRQLVSRLLGRQSCLVYRTGDFQTFTLPLIMFHLCVLLFITKSKSNSTLPASSCFRRRKPMLENGTHMLLIGQGMRTNASLSPDVPAHGPGSRRSMLAGKPPEAPSSVTPIHIPVSTVFLIFPISS